MSMLTLFESRYRLWSVVAERSSALDSSSGVVRMWVRITARLVAALMSLSKTLNHNCFVLRMGRKAVGPVRCVMHVKEPSTLIVKEKGLASVFLDSRLEHPSGWICARYKSSVLLLLLLLLDQIINLWNYDVVHKKMRSVVAERSSLPDSSSGVSNRMWVRIPAVTLVSLSKTLNHNCFSPPRG